MSGVFYIKYYASVILKRKISANIIIVSEKSCNFALINQRRAIHCTQEIAKATVSLLCGHSLFLLVRYIAA